MKIDDIVKNVQVYGLEESIRGAKFPMSVDVDSLNSEVTPGIKKLAQSERGSGHDQFLSSIIVQFDLTFTIKAWTEIERYHFVDFCSSQSTMHRISKFNLSEQYIHYVDPRMIDIMKELKDEYEILVKENKKDLAKQAYLSLLYSNPCGCKLTARMTTNYRQLKTIYFQRRSHRLPEWRVFCVWIESLPMFKELILGEESE